MTDKFSLYNAALLDLGEPRLASLAEAREARYALDDAYVNAVKFCLEQGYWKFATRSSQRSYAPSLEPAFGYQRAFEKPTDWVRTYQVSLDEFFRQFHNEITDEDGFWFTDADNIYVRYISDDASYGMDLGKWPETFTRYVSYHLAARTAKRITGSDSIMENMLALEKRAKNNALSKDAMNGTPDRIPYGSWVTSRRSYNSHITRG